MLPFFRDTLYFVPYFENSCSNSHLNKNREFGFGFQRNPSQFTLRNFQSYRSFGEIWQVQADHWSWDKVERFKKRDRL